MGGGGGAGREGAVGLSPEVEGRIRRRTLAVSFDPLALSCARKRCDLQVKRARERAGWEGWLGADQSAATASVTRQRCASSQAARLEIQCRKSLRRGRWGTSLGQGAAPRQRRRGAPEQGAAPWQRRRGAPEQRGKAVTRLEGYIFPFVSQVARW